MPIAVACSCGVKLKAPDAAAGKRVKCPKCGSPVSVPVPAPASDFEMVDDDPPPVAAPAKKKPKLVDDDDPPPTTKKMPTAAKTQPMPKPKPKPVVVDEPVDDDDEDEDEKPKKKAKARSDEDEDEGEEEDEKPKKKGKGKGKKKKDEPKSKLPLILGIGGGVVVLLAIVGIVIAVMMNSGPGKPTGPPPPPPPPPLPAGWSTFKGEGFSVAVPDAVGFKEQQQPPNAGGPRGQPASDGKNYSNSVPVQPGQPFTVYLVSTGPLPPEVKAEFAKSSQAGWEALKKTDKTLQLQNEKTVQLSGVEGRQFTMNLGGGFALVRMAVKGDRGYVAMVMAQAAPAEDGPEVKPFFDTFKIE